MSASALADTGDQRFSVMGILDRLRGGGAAQRQEATPSTSGREEPSEILGNDEHVQPQEAPDLFRGIPDVNSIPPGSAIGSLPSPPGSSQRLYNPYEGLESALDRRVNKQAGSYSLPDQPEFLFDEEATVHRRNWSENITYYTGTGYLGGDPGSAISHAQCDYRCICFELEGQLMHRCFDTMPAVPLAH